MLNALLLICGNCLVEKQRARFGSSETCLSPPPTLSNLLLTVPRRYFCCGSSVLHIMSVCIWSLAIWSAEYQLSIMLPVLFCVVI